MLRRLRLLAMHLIISWLYAFPLSAYYIAAIYSSSGLANILNAKLGSSLSYPRNWQDLFFSVTHLMHVSLPKFYVHVSEGAEYSVAD